MENACYTIVRRNQFSEQLFFLTKKSVWVKLTRQIRINVLGIGNPIIHQWGLFSRSGEGRGGQFEIGLRCQVWRETRLLSVPVKETMTSISGVRVLEIIAMNHLQGKPSEPSAWAQCNLPHPYDPHSPKLHVTSPQVGRYSGQVWICLPRASPPLGNSSSPTSCKCSSP